MALPCLRGSASRHVRQACLPSVHITSFSTSTAMEAAKKASARAPVVKKKTAIRKTGASGPRSPKKRGSGGGDTSSSISRSNPFLQPKKGMSQLPELVPESATPDKVHQVFAWTQRTLQATRIQGFGLPRETARQFVSAPRPSTILRPSSLQLFDMLDQAAASPSSSNTLLQGPTGSGMSTLLLQSFSYALESSWVVIYIPRTINLVDSSSPYSYNPSLQTYLQPAIARSMLEKILSINEDLLAKISTPDGAITLDRGTKIEAGTKLTDVIREGLKSSATAVASQQVLETVLRTLVQQRDVPVLMAIDGAQALFSSSLYRDADYKQLQSYELAVPRLLQACLRKTGSGSFGGIQRGTVLSALSLQHKEWPIPDEMKSAMQLDFVEPYARLDNVMQQVVQDCQFEKLDLGAGLTRAEAISLFDLARQQGGLWNTANDELLMTKLVESGGNLGTFDRSLRSSIL